MQNLQQQDISIEYYGAFTRITTSLCQWLQRVALDVSLVRPRRIMKLSHSCFSLWWGSSKNLRIIAPSFLAVLHLLLWMRHLLVWSPRKHVCTPFPHPPLRWLTLVSLLLIEVRSEVFLQEMLSALIARSLCTQMISVLPFTQSCWLSITGNFLFSNNIDLLLKDLLLLWPMGHHNQRWVTLCLPLLV